MTWLTWRQHRAEAGVAALLVAVFAVFALLSGLPAHTAYRDDGVSACLADPTEGCGGIVTRFAEHYNGTNNSPVVLLLLLVPAVAGMFIGAPLLAREFEEGTWQLAWTQSVPRLRWLVSKLLLVTLGTAAGAIAISGIYAWWHAPFDRITARFDLAPFEFGIPVFTAHTLFAVAVGILAGVLLRRTLPAMAVTLVVYIAVAFPVATQLRPHYMEPRTAVGLERVTDDPFESWGDWNLEQDLGEADSPIPNPVTTYHPASRFWAFQLIEAAIYLTLAVALLGCVVLRIHRKAG